jgi:hypothetical protein
VKEAKLRKTKPACFLSYVGDRYSTNTSKIMKNRFCYREITNGRGRAIEGS